MDIRTLNNKTKTYLAGDWTGDKDAIDKLHQWNKGNFWSLHFIDVHDLTQSRDSSNNCNIKSSLRTRMGISKTFVLIVGEHTKSLKSGVCYLCDWYRINSCLLGYSVDNRSYIEYECDMAIKENAKIVVLYNSIIVNRGKCPEVLRNKGIHIPMKKFNHDTWNVEWDYQTVKSAIND